MRCRVSPTSWAWTGGTAHEGHHPAQLGVGRALHDTPPRGSAAHDPYESLKSRHPVPTAGRQHARPRNVQPRSEATIIWSLEIAVSDVVEVA